MIKTGRYGQVKYDADAGGAGAAVVIASLNRWKLSLKTDKTEVTSFGDGNKVYVPGLKDISGDFSGFWNSAELTLFTAIDAADPGALDLVPNSTEPDFHWTGLAYLDAEIEVGVADAPTVTGSFSAAGTWTFETGA
jgi:hypothetical protein